jgi:peptide/nickel transport system substrate-binding protein
LALALLAGACGGDDEEGGSDGATEEPGVSGVEDAGTPVPGGDLVYGLEAESSGGWCLSEAQLAASGIQVARAIYDTLTAPDENGEIQPFLAESVTPNETFDSFVIKIRQGVTFHDGSPLDAQVVANNLDAYRGAYPARKPLLFTFVFSNVASVTVTDPTTVTVTTKTPWPAFPWTLWGTGRIGITSQSQLDDPTSCDKQLVGTGPFMQESWTVNQSFKATKNPNYWGKDADGNQLPYLDSIEFRPIIDGAQRVNLLQSGEIQAMHTSFATQIDTLRSLGDDVNLIESDKFGEVGYYMLNAGEGKVFSNQTARLAAAHAIDRERINEVRGLGIPTVANGPFAPGNIGNLPEGENDFPEYDLDEAKRLVAEYESTTGNEFRIKLSNTTEPDTVATADMLEEMLTDAGIKVDRDQFEQAQLINNALAGNFDMIQWRNHPGGHPDLQYNWWATGSPVNFGRIADPELQSLLDQGRAATTPEEEATAYEDLNRLFAEKVYNIWQSYAIWAVGTSPEVQGILGPELPDGGKPFPGLATGHPVSGMWFARK